MANMAFLSSSLVSYAQSEVPDQPLRRLKKIQRQHLDNSVGKSLVSLCYVVVLMSSFRFVLQCNSIAV